ncbi:hypothetical protein KAR91_57360 [Candidatus Pacearchaeota archaeon]|nr:hypothetical protein [Candidatus Pacearchaeota archaeon]
MLNGLDPIEDVEATEQERHRMYLSVFTGESGKAVLEDMLYDLYFMRECTTPEQQALNNYAKQLLNTIHGPVVRPGKLKTIIRKLLFKGKKDG